MYRETPLAVRSRYRTIELGAELPREPDVQVRRRGGLLEAVLAHAGQLDAQAGLLGLAEEEAAADRALVGVTAVVHAPEGRGELELRLADAAEAVGDDAVGRVEVEHRVDHHRVQRDVREVVAGGRVLPLALELEQLGEVPAAAETVLRSALARNVGVERRVPEVGTDLAAAGLRREREHERNQDQHQRYLPHHDPS